MVFGFAGKFFRIGCQNTWPAFEEQNAGLLGVDLAKLVVQRVARDFGQRACEFDAGGAASDDDKLKRRFVLGVVLGGLILIIVTIIVLALGQFEGQQNAAADFQGVFNRLQTGREQFPLRVTEVSMSGAGSDHQKVVIEDILLGNDLVLFQLEIDCFFKQYFNIAVAS